MGDLGVHKADLLRWLLGEEIVEAAAMVEHLYKPMGDVDDNAVCLLRAASGAMGTLTASWTHNPGEDNATTLYGEKGIIRLGSDPNFSVIVELASGEKQFIQAGKTQYERVRRPERHRRDQGVHPLDPDGRGAADPWRRGLQVAGGDPGLPEVLRNQEVRGGGVLKDFIRRLRR